MKFKNLVAVSLITSTVLPNFNAHAMMARILAQEEERKRNIQIAQERERVLQAASSSSSILSTNKRLNDALESNNLMGVLAAVEDIVAANSGGQPAVDRDEALNYIVPGSGDLKAAKAEINKGDALGGIDGNDDPILGRVQKLRAASDGFATYLEDGETVVNAQAHLEKKNALKGIPGKDILTRVRTLRGYAEDVGTALGENDLAKIQVAADASQRRSNVLTAVIGELTGATDDTDVVNAAKAREVEAKRAPTLDDVIRESGATDDTNVVAITKKIAGDLKNAEAELAKLLPSIKDGAANLPEALDALNKKKILKGYGGKDIAERVENLRKDFDAIQIELATVIDFIEKGENFANIQTHLNEATALDGIPGGDIVVRVRTLRALAEAAATELGEGDLTKIQAAAKNAADAEAKAKADTLTAQNALALSDQLIDDTRAELEGKPERALLVAAAKASKERNDILNLILDEFHGVGDGGILAEIQTTKAHAGNKLVAENALADSDQLIADVRAEVIGKPKRALLVDAVKNLQARVAVLDDLLKVWPGVGDDKIVAEFQTVKKHAEDKLVTENELIASNQIIDDTRTNLGNPDRADLAATAKTVNDSVKIFNDLLTKIGKAEGDALAEVDRLLIETADKARVEGDLVASNQMIDEARGKLKTHPDRDKLVQAIEDAQTSNDVLEVILGKIAKSAAEAPGEIDRLVTEARDKATVEGDLRNAETDLDNARKAIDGTAVDLATALRNVSTAGGFPNDGRTLAVHVDDLFKANDTAQKQVLADTGLLNTIYPKVGQGVDSTTVEAKLSDLQKAFYDRLLNAMNFADTVSRLNMAGKKSVNIPANFGYKKAKITVENKKTSDDWFLHITENARDYVFDKLGKNLGNFDEVVGRDLAKAQNVVAQLNKFGAENFSLIDLYALDQGAHQMVFPFSLA